MLDAGLPLNVGCDFYFCYCVKLLGDCHDVTDAFSEVAELNPDVLEESIYGKSTYDDYHFWVHSI